MEIIIQGSETQISKMKAETDVFAVSQTTSCSGECYDCDSCGGPITH